MYRCVCARRAVARKQRQGLCVAHDSQCKHLNVGTISYKAKCDVQSNYAEAKNMGMGGVHQKRGATADSYMCVQVVTDTALLSENTQAMEMWVLSMLAGVGASSSGTPPPVLSSSSMASSVVSAAAAAAAVVLLPLFSLSAAIAAAAAVVAAASCSSTGRW